MCFDVPKVVRSPGCDHGHDEESRNGRDVKIDILDDYIRSSERFRVIRVFIGVLESYGNSPGSILSRPICDTILKRLEGPTKDRTAY